MSKKKETRNFESVLAFLKSRMEESIKDAMDGKPSLDPIYAEINGKEVCRFGILYIPGDLVKEICDFVTTLMGKEMQTREETIPDLPAKPKYPINPSNN